MNSLKQNGARVDFTVAIPVDDSPFQLPEEIDSQSIRDACRDSFSHLMCRVNGSFGTETTNKYPGVLGIRKDRRGEPDIQYRFAGRRVNTSRAGVRAINFNIDAAPAAFAKFVRENLKTTNDFYTKLSGDPRMGGNNINVFNTRAKWIEIFESKFKTMGIENSIPSQVIALSDGIEGQGHISKEYVEQLIDRYPELFEMHIMNDVPFRRSWHVPFENLKGNPDTMMLGEPHPDLDTIMPELKRIFADVRDQRFRQLFTPIDLHGEDIEYDQQILVPSSAFPGHMKSVVERGEFLGGNDEELRVAVGNTIPEILVGASIDMDRKTECEAVVRQYWHPKGTDELTQLEEMGIRSGSTMGVYSRKKTMYGVQNTRVEPEQDQDIFDPLEMDTVGKNVEGVNTTGGGDSKLGTQTFLVEVLPTYLEVYLANHSISASTKEKDYITMMTIETMGAIAATIARASTQASLWNVPADKLEKIFDEVLDTIVEGVKNANNGSQMFIHGPYGINIVAWDMQKVQ